MKMSIKERGKSKLLRIGKKNQACRVIILPVLFVWMFFFRAITYCRQNGKRFSVLAMTFLLFAVYISFSCPAFVTSAENVDDRNEEEEMFSNVSLAVEEELDIADMKILDDDDVLDDYEYDETSHGLDIIDKYNADDILRSTENRKSQAANANENVDEEDVSGVFEFSKDDWRLVLINKQHSIPDDYTFELGNITDTMLCDERIIDDLRDMLQAAKEDEVNLVICSPYRDDNRQTMLFNRKITRYMKKGMSFVEAYQLASQAVTVPGASEHQIGLALDIVSDEYSSLDEGFGDTDAGKWLAENSCRFGFILRYPTGKE